METVRDVILGGSKMTADGDCSHEIKRRLLLGRKAMSNLDSMLKSRDITLPKKACLVKAMVFPVVMHGCESWTIKKAECQRTDVPGASVRNSTRDKVMRQSSDGKANQTSGFPLEFPEHPPPKK